MKKFQRINYIPGIEHICRKNLLKKNLFPMQKQYQKQYDFFPRTFNLPLELYNFKTYLQKNPKASFIMKPENNCQGKGIHIFKKINEFDVFESNPCVVQQYIKNPLLIDGLKWDLRIYVLVASVEPLRIFIFKEGMARFATEPYAQLTKKNQKNSYQHLTNYAINKNHPNYKKQSDSETTNESHKRTLSQIFDLITNNKKDQEEIWESIKKITVLSLISVQSQLKNTVQSYFFEQINSNIPSCFQIIGFDILIDQNLKPWLLEINSFPSFNQDTKIDLDIKSQLIKDTFQILGLNQKKAKDENKEQYLEEKLSHLFSKQKKIDKEQKRIQNEEIQKERDCFMSNNLGNFESLNEYLEDEFYIEILEFQKQNYKKNLGVYIQDKNDLSKSQLQEQPVQKSVTENKIRNIKSQYKQAEVQQEPIETIKPKTKYRINFIKQNIKLDLDQKRFNNPQNLYNKLKERLKKEIDQQESIQKQKQSEQISEQSTNDITKINNNSNISQKIKNNKEGDKDKIIKQFNDYQQSINKFKYLSMEFMDYRKIFKDIQNRETQIQSTLGNIHQYDKYYNFKEGSMSNQLHLQLNNHNIFNNNQIDTKIVNYASFIRGR